MRFPVFFRKSRSPIEQKIKGEGAKAVFFRTLSAEILPPSVKNPENRLQNQNYFAKL